MTGAFDDIPGPLPVLFDRARVQRTFESLASEGSVLKARRAPHSKRRSQTVRI